MTILDVSTKGFVPAKHYFNASIFLRAEKCFLAYRANNNKEDARIVITELDFDHKRFHPIGRQYELRFPEVYPGKHLFEDPRIFHFRGQIWIAFTNVNLENGCQCQGYASLDEHFRVEKVYYPAWGYNINGCTTPKMARNEEGEIVVNFEFPVLLEKNWIFFEDNNQLRFIYRATPHHNVVSMWEHGEPMTCAATESNIIWPYGDVRGGTPPMRYDDKHWITFFHSSFEPNFGTCHTRFDGRIYTVGAYLFTKENNYQVKYYTKRPLLIGDVTAKTFLWNHAVVFPCGAFEFDSDWFVSYGHNDHRIKVMKINKAELQNEFVEVNKTKICLPKRTKLPK